MTQYIAEDKAKQKSCPLTFSLPAETMESWYKCVGSWCMWWQEEPHLPGALQDDAEIKGRCAMVNK